MSKPENILLQLTSRALFNAPTDFDPTTMDWHALYQEATAQALSLLIWDVLSDEERAAIPDDIIFRWEQDSFHHIVKNEQLLYEQEQVVQILNEASIPCAILKGSSAAANYPQPSLRIMGDIDILVKPEDQLKTVEVLQANGYGDLLSGSIHYHLSVAKDGITVEVHKEPNGVFAIENTNISSKMHDFFEDAIERRQIVNGLPFLSDDQQAVVLILHKLEHFLSEGLGLRQLCDWAAFVNKKLDESLWSTLKPQLKEFGLMTFTAVITRACVDYLGLPEDKAPWAMEEEKTLSDEVMEQILEEGNFGVKTKTADYGIHYFTNVNSKNRLTSFLKVLVSHCKIHWPLCAKYPILMPIAPFVAFWKYLKLRKEGKRAAIKPVSLYKKAGAKQRLYKELKPFVVE